MTSDRPLLHVAAGVIVDATGRILVAKRAVHRHQGGLWEFPGGKVEPGESAAAALRRELHEELGIDVTAARPLLRVPHHYPDRSVLLDVWRVDGFTGEPHGREGQPVRWVPPDALPGLAFPAANRPIVIAARLPDRYLITPDPGPEPGWAAFLDRLESLVLGGIRLVQLRAKSLPEAALQRLAEQAVARTRAAGARLLVNGSPELAIACGADGVHLTGERLAALNERPLAEGLWVAASCHDAAQLAAAERIGADFAVVSPVLPTASHPDAVPLGWPGLHRLTEATALPIYALGGVAPAHLQQAWTHGAQGIAGIRGLWGTAGN